MWNAVEPKVGGERSVRDVEIRYYEANEAEVLVEKRRRKRGTTIDTANRMRKASELLRLDELSSLTALTISRREVRSVVVCNVPRMLGRHVPVPSISLLQNESLMRVFVSNSVDVVCLLLGRSRVRPERQGRLNGNPIFVHLDDARYLTEESTLRSVVRSDSEESAYMLTERGSLPLGVLLLLQKDVHLGSS